MKVKLRSSKHSGWLTLGKVYNVLSVEYTPEGLSYRLKSEQNNQPALFPISDFKVESNDIPSAWVIREESGSIELSPKEWCVEGFWEDFFDGEKYALDTFQRVLNNLESNS